MKSHPLRYWTFAATLFCGLASAQENAWQISFTQEAAGQYAEAQREMDKVLQETPNNEFALLRRAWLNYLQAHHNDAWTDYRNALAVNPKSLEARLGLTLPLIAQQRWREAAFEAGKVLQESPWDYTAHLRLMTCEEAERKWETLAKHAREVSARYPSDATVWVFLARAEAWQYHVPQAKTAYAQVLQRVPGHFEATAYFSNNP